MANTSGRVNFHARVAANVINMLRRELEMQESQLDAEWEGLDALLGPAPRPARLAQLRSSIEARNVELSQRIQGGDADAGPFRERVLEHLRSVVHDKLAVANPGWIPAAG